MSEAQNPLEDIFEDRCHPSVVASGPFKFDPPHWREDGTCSHCGGCKPSIILEAVRNGAEVEPTDKSYKIYVEIPDPNEGQVRVVSTMNFTPEDYDPAERGYVKADPAKLKESGWHSEGVEWMQLAPRGPLMRVKCYLNHFGESQALEFVRLIESGKMKISYPGHFYRPLAFARYKESIQKLLVELKLKPE